ncbi:MAG: hypothetical protein Q8P92_00680 [Candidatus Daviesbacteria bacterium]|nr:hypothetical protein [Candidatus Daviesbacteria bacterium]
MKKSLLLISLISFLILYLELALIRYLPAYIYYLGYFTNFIFIASILGMGLGVMLGGLKRNLIHFVLPILFILILGAKFLYLGIDPSDPGIIFFKDINKGKIILNSSFIISLVFILVALIFTCISQSLGRLLNLSQKPLAAYVADLIGAILGVIVFRLGIFYAAEPAIWFLQFCLFFLIFYYTQIKSKVRIFQILIAALLILVVVRNIEGFENIWSPYYKITVITDNKTKTTDVYANGIGHQSFSRLINAKAYNSIYSQLSRLNHPLNNLLIIGAGTGQDVSAALAFGAKHIDAVEIDPQILKIGKERHPEKPYQDHRVSTYIDDGRHFLEVTDKKYDFIILALTDSLVANSRFGQARLEGYLFTVESFKKIREKLNDGGYMVAYNDYRQDWLIKRLIDMMTVSFGKFYQERVIGNYSRILLAKNEPGMNTLVIQKLLPTDDWPFLYIKEKNIPRVYLDSLGIILLITLLSLWLILKKVKIISDRVYGRLFLFFFLGAAFALLETKSIGQLALIFGSTWYVNAVAFIGILLVTLFAALLNLKFNLINTRILFIGLFLSIAAQYFIHPISFMMINEDFSKFILALIYFFLPVGFANCLFAKFFKESKTASLEFGSNLLGLVFGSMVEYTVMIIGFINLTLIIGLFYLIAFIAMLLLSREKISSISSSGSNILHR